MPKPLPTPFEQLDIMHACQNTYDLMIESKTFGGRNEIIKIECARPKFGCLFSLTKMVLSISLCLCGPTRSNRRIEKIQIQSTHDTHSNVQTNKRTQRTHFSFCLFVAKSNEDETKFPFQRRNPCVCTLDMVRRVCRVIPKTGVRILTHHALRIHVATQTR